MNPVCQCRKDATQEGPHRAGDRFRDAADPFDAFGQGVVDQRDAMFDVGHADHAAQHHRLGYARIKKVSRPCSAQDHKPCITPCQAWRSAWLGCGLRR